MLYLNNDLCYSLVEKAIAYNLEGSNTYNNSFKYKCLVFYITTVDGSKYVTIKYEKDNTEIVVYNDRGFLREEEEYREAISKSLNYLTEVLYEIELKAVEQVKSDFDIKAPEEDNTEEPPEESPEGGITETEESSDSASSENNVLS